MVENKILSLFFYSSFVVQYHIFTLLYYSIDRIYTVRHHFFFFFFIYYFIIASYLYREVFNTAQYTTYIQYYDMIA